MPARAHTPAGERNRKELEMNAWHFVGEKLGDGRPIPPDGEWLVHDGELVMCESGLHASVRLIDALIYAPGNTICRVEVDGEILHDDDKLVAEKRKILWRIEGEQVLTAFARWCALQVVHLWDAPDVVIKYLTTGNENTRAAASDAARYAARSAARSADWAADWAAASDADWAAARSAQETQLLAMVEEARNGKTEWIF